MKVTLERSELVKALAHVHRVVERRNTIPILANVLIRAGKGGLELKATDLDLEIIENVPAEVKQPGATTVPVEHSDETNARIRAGSEDMVQGFVRQPVPLIAERSGVPLDIVLERIRAMLEAGVIRRVRQSFGPEMT